MQTPIFICFGELLFDLYPDGPRLGGSAANVAINLHRLGAKPLLVSRVGCDELGDAALHELSNLGLDTSLVQRDERAPTGSVDVTVIDGEPKFRIATESAWDRIEIGPRHFELSKQASGIIYGTLAQRTLLVKGGLQALLTSRPKSCLTICDLNLRPPHVERAAVQDALKFADVVKLNEQELARVGELFQTRDPLQLVLHDNGARLVAVTRGERGCSLYTREQTVEHGGFPLLSGGGDAVGAGDAFTAALALEHISGAPLGVIAEKANDHARRVASARGGFGFVT